MTAALTTESAAVRNDPPVVDDFGVVVRVIGGVVLVGPIVVVQGTSPWIVSDPPVEAALDVALSTRASEATLAGVLTTTAFQATGTLGNGAEVAVAGVAVEILAANAAAKSRIVQNTGVANIRVGVAGVTAVTGLRLAPGESVTFNAPYCPTNAIFAIREGAVSSVALGQEIT